MHSIRSTYAQHTEYLYEILPPNSYFTNQVFQRGSGKNEVTDFVERDGIPLTYGMRNAIPHHVTYLVTTTSKKPGS